MKKLVLISIAAASSLLAAQIAFSNAPSDFERLNPAAGGNVVLSFNSSIREAKKSVVNISTSKTVKTQAMSPFDDPFFQEFFGFHFKNQGGGETSRKSTSLGSGVIISKNGYIVTNSHVVEGSDEIVVTLLDNSKEYKAKIIGSDSKTDVAIIKIDAENLTAIAFADSDKASEGDVVFAIGNPFGVGGSVSQGIISALNKDNIGLNQYEDFIQTDASINPGNSGGALVDSRGALLGINSAILSRSGGNNGIGFAIPSNMVKQIAGKLVKDGKISRGYLGVSISNLSEDQKDLYAAKKGALIVNVEKGGPADKAGLQRGDLITRVNTTDITSANDLKNFIGSLNPNEKVEIKFERDGKEKSLGLALSSMDGGSHASAGEGTLKFGGLEIKNLTSEIKSKYRVAKDAKGVIITSVKDGSNAAKAGFKEGDLLVQIGSKPVASVAELSRELENARKNGKKAMIWVERGNMTMGLALRLDEK